MRIVTILHQLPPYCSVFEKYELRERSDEKSPVQFPEHALPAGSRCQSAVVTVNNKAACQRNIMPCTDEKTIHCYFIATCLFLVFIDGVLTDFDQLICEKKAEMRLAEVEWKTFIHRLKSNGRL